MSELGGVRHCICDCGIVDMVTVLRSLGACGVDDACSELPLCSLPLPLSRVTGPESRLLHIQEFDSWLLTTIF